jgi:hypothetical protein
MAGVSPVTARRWQSGKLPVPAQVGAAIEAMARAAVLLSAKHPAARTIDHAGTAIKD